MLKKLVTCLEGCWRSIPLFWRDPLTTLLLLSAAAAFCAVLHDVDPLSSYPNLIFVLAVALIARLTDGYFWGIFASLCSVICVNYIFTYPFWVLNFTMTGYPLTFMSMLSVSCLVSAMTTQVKKSERLRMETEKEAVRANLLRAMSHDIRTPLTGIVGNTAALLENEESISPQQRRQLLQDVNEDAQWLIQMVENLLSITRISGEQTPIHKEVEVLEEIVAVAVSKFEKRFKDQIAIAVKVPDEVLLVPMDATLVQQVLMNLLENAVLHGKTTTGIAITLLREGRYAVVAVRDNGKGIPRERLEHLFKGVLREVSQDNFDKKKNMGIGLSVCETIVRIHGGTISAENCEGGGACFRFSLLMEEENNED